MQTKPIHSVLLPIGRAFDLEAIAGPRMVTNFGLNAVRFHQVQGIIISAGVVQPDEFLGELERVLLTLPKRVLDACKTIELSPPCVVGETGVCQSVVNLEQFGNFMDALRSHTEARLGSERHVPYLREEPWFLPIAEVRNSRDASAVATRLKNIEPGLRFETNRPILYCAEQARPLAA